MGADFNKKAYEEIYKHGTWEQTADRYEEQFAAKLYQTPYVQEAAKTALTKLSRMLNAYYGNRDQNLNEEAVENAEAAREMAGQIAGEAPARGPQAGGEERVEITDTLLEALLPQGDSSGGAGQIGNFRQNLNENSSAQERQEAEATDRGNLNDVINGDGNLRERMTMLYNGMFVNGGRGAEQIARSRSLKNMMAYITQENAQKIPELQGVRLDLLEGMEQREKRGDVFDTFSIARDLKKSSDRIEGKGNKLTRFFAGLIRGFNAGLSSKFTRQTRSAQERERNRMGEAHYNNLGLGLSRRERINGIRNGQLQWQEGRAWYKMKKPVNAEGMLQTAGPSGTTLRMLGAYKLMGASLKELLYFRLALIAWMVTSKDHSLYEIMKGSQNAGITGKEDLSEPATMYMSVDPIPVDVLRQEFAPEHQFPHEVVYKTMLNELRDRRQARAQARRAKGGNGQEYDYTLFGKSESGVMHDIGSDARNADAHDIALNIYTTGAYLAMTRGQKYGESFAKGALTDKRVDRYEKNGFGSYEYSSSAEMKDKGLADSIFKMIRISSRMSQEALEERGQTEEADLLAGEPVPEGEAVPNPANASTGRSAFTGTTYRGGTLTSEFKAGGDSVITLGSMMSSTKSITKAAQYFRKGREREGENNAVLIEYGMRGKGAVDISGLSKVQYEQEVLIPASTRFRVVTPLRKASVTTDGIQWNGPQEEVARPEEAGAQKEEGAAGEKKQDLPAYGYVVRLEEVEGPGSARRNEQGEVPQMRREIRDAYRQTMERRRRQVQR